MKNTADISIKIALLWVIMVIGFALHGSYHVSEIIYGIDIKSPRATGTVPLPTHIIRIVLEACILLLAALTLTIGSKGFRKFSLIWSFLLLPLNLFHLASTAVHDISDYSQIAILSLVLAVNVLLILTIRQWTKTDDSFN